MLNSTALTDQAFTRRYRCAPQLKWSVERRGLTLVDSQRGAFFCLSYPCAALWDLLARGYRIDEAVRLTAFVAGTSVDLAQSRVTRAFEDWIALGLFLPEGDDG